MSAEENKKLVLGFFEDMSAGNAEAFLGAMADNATWWVAGNPKDFPLEHFDPSGGQIAGSLALALVGFGITQAVAWVGRDQEEEPA